MTAYRRKTGWAAKYMVNGEMINVPHSPWPTKRAAQDAERRHRERIASRATDETCASFADRWLEEWPRPAASTRALYAQAAKRFADEFTSTPLGEVERLSARAWALGIPRNLSKILGTMYEDARNVGIVKDNPFANLRLPKTEKTEEIVPPTPDEFRQLLRACTVLGGYAKEYRAFLQFAAWTGMRGGELHALQWADIQGDVIRVRRSRKTDGTIGKPKNGEEREIAFLEPARVLDHVRPWDGSPFVFHTPRGEPLRKGNSYYHWNKIRAGVSLTRAEADLPGLRFHDLRHFCATQLLELGLSHFDVSVQLGHTDGGALVMARYGHPSKDAARRRLLAAFGSSDNRVVAGLVARSQ